MGAVAVVVTAETQVGITLFHELRQRNIDVFCSDIRAPSVVAEATWDEDGGIDVLIVHPKLSMPAPDSTKIDFTSLRQTYDTSVLGMLRSVEAFLPLMQEGQKRLCFVTDAVWTSGNRASTNNLGGAMFDAALGMAYKILFNDLRRDGYTFRLFRLDVETVENDVRTMIDYFLSPHTNEDTLVIRDSYGKEIAL